MYKGRLIVMSDINFSLVMGVDHEGKSTASYSIVVKIKRPAKASEIACPIVAQPEKLGFGCAFSSIGSAGVRNVTMLYVEKDDNGKIISPEVAKVTQGLGALKDHNFVLASWLCK